MNSIAVNLLFQNQFSVLGLEVRSGDDPLEAQARLIRDGEAATPQSLELEKQAKAASHADDLNDEESAVEIDEEFDDAGEQE